MKIHTYNSERLNRRATTLAGNFVAAIGNGQFLEAQEVVDTVPSYFTEEALPVAVAEMMYEVIRLTKIGSWHATIFLSAIGGTMCEAETGDR